MKMNFLQKVLLRSFYTVLAFSIPLTFGGLLFANNGYSQKSLDEITISVDFNAVSLQGAFQQLESQTDFTFAYQENIFNANADKKVSKKFKETSMSGVLSFLSKTYNLHFKRIDNTINVNIVDKPMLFIEENYQQPNRETITGVVKAGDNNEPIPGVTIIIKGTSNGTTTDLDGKYTIQASSGDVLQFSYIGYKTSEVVVDNQSVIDVTLDVDLTQLDEIVVVGYGTQKRAEVTGAIASIDGEEIEKLQIQSMDQALQGRAPGVVVTQNSGEPGGNVSVRIRGVGSFGNNEPLYVIDGFPLFNDNGRVGSAGNSENQFNSLATLNPKDIESIEILKDASAAAIYGARAANGVVLITTKRGKAGQAKVTFSTDIGFQEAWSTPDFLNAQEFAELANETYTNAGQPVNPEWANPASLGAGTDWVDAMFRTGLMQDYNIGVSGGNEKVQASVSLNYFNQEGIIINSGFERYSLRANLDYTVNDKLKVGTSTTLSHTDQQVFRTDNFASGLFNIGLMLPPTIGIDEAVDGPGLYYTTVFDNVVQRSEELDENLNVIRTLSTAFAEYEFIPGLKYRLNVGADMILSRGTFWQPSVTRGVFEQPFAVASERRSQDVSWLIENTLSYSKTFNEKHTINALIGQTAQRSEFSQISASGQEFPNNDVRAINLSTFRNSGGNGTRWALASYIGRINYNYDDRYLLSASVRYDGSSRFGSENRWGVFPSFSAGWRVSEESFFDVAWIDDLKVRASWGQLGNDRIGDFVGQTLFVAGINNEYTLGDGAQQPISGVALGRLGNPDLQWETSTQTDIGLDVAFFEGRLNLVVDYFIKNTTDLLVAVPVPQSSGVPSPIVNAGEVRNRGLEVALGYREIKGDFSYGIDVNFATLDNEVISIGAGQPITGGGTNAADRFSATRTEVGQSIGYFFGFQVDGIYQTEDELNGVNDFRNPQPGDFIFRDTNGRDADGNLTGQPDGVINDDDRTNIGSPIPDFTYGLNINLGWKNFDLNAFFQGVAGNEIFSVIKQQTMQMSYFNGSGVTNSYRDILDRWTGPNTSNTVPRQSYQEVNNYNFSSSFYVEDGSFLRMRNLQLGYTLPNDLTEKIGLGSARFYVGAQNLFTITDYSGFDPEIGDNNQNPLNGGIDYGQYPQARTYRMGLSVQF